MPHTSSSFIIPTTDGLLAAQRWGRADRPVIVLVHGYPDCRHVWDQVAPLLARDFHVVAYDVRGAGASFKPRARKAYRLAHLTRDFEAVIDTVSPDAPVHLVGHDWGSVQGWEFVSNPALRGRIASFTSCSGPSLDHMGLWMRRMMAHPGGGNLRHLLRQTLKSWYVYLFHLPLLPELAWRLYYGAHWPRLLARLEGIQVPAHPSQTQDGIHGLQLYRANVWPCLSQPRTRQVTVPVQVLVPSRDPFVSPQLSEDLQAWVPRLERQFLALGHWVPLKDPELFAHMVRRFVLAREAESPTSTPLPEALTTSPCPA